jgi:hypothetical protein
MGKTPRRAAGDSLSTSNPSKIFPPLSHSSRSDMEKAVKPQRRLYGFEEIRTKTNSVLHGTLKQ